MLVPRTSLSIKPGIYLEDKFWVRSEIGVYVGEREPRAVGEPLRSSFVVLSSIAIARNLIRYPNALEIVLDVLDSLF